MNNLEQLENEVIEGNKAKSAYNTFIKSFVESKRAVIAQAFSDCNINDKEGIMELKRMLYAVNLLNDEVQSLINTGKMARAMIDKQEQPEN